MRSDGQKRAQGPNGLIPNSFKTISGYLRIVQSGASSVASTVRSAASSIVDRNEDIQCDQVLWAGFDKLEHERDVIRRVLLLGYRYGFQVWDVEETHNIHVLVSRHDGPVSILQMLPKPLSTMACENGFSDSRPLMVVCTAGRPLQDGMNATGNGGNPSFHNPGNGYYAPSTVQFYSLTSQSYVHVLKFRSAVYSVRCSRQVVAVSQAAQVHCFNAATLEKEYTILTNPVVTGGLGSGGRAFGALALGSRWLAHSGSLIKVSSEGCTNPRHLTPSVTFRSSALNGTHVAQYAKESSKQLKSGGANLGDAQYRKLSRYCSELLPNANCSVPSRVGGRKANGTINGHLHEGDNVGMVIVKDVVSKAVITQFRAHKSPISALSFDPSGTLLATASVHGHNVNVFCIIPQHPGVSSVPEAVGSYVHLYRLQRGVTDAVIQDITFSNDSCWFMISSSRGTSHLFAISPFGRSADVFDSKKLSVIENPAYPAVRWKSKLSDQSFNPKCPFESGSPVSLSAVNRIRNGNNGWRGAVNGAASAAIGKNNSMCGAIAAAFHLCKDCDFRINTHTLKSKYQLLVFSPSGCLIQYAMQLSNGLETAATFSSAYESGPGNDSKLIFEPIQRWNIGQKWREQEENFDIYGENGSWDTYRPFHSTSRNGYDVCSVSQCTTTQSEISLEERNHFLVSEAELKTHGQKVPLWICFQLMADDMKLDGDLAGGETEIEKIPTRMIEARNKNVVPVSNYLDSLRLQPTSVGASDIKLEPGQLLQAQGFSQNASLSDSNESHASSLVTENGSLRPANETTGSVKTNSVNDMSQAQIVNNTDRECSKLDAQSKLVNNTLAKLDNRESV